MFQKVFFFSRSGTEALSWWLLYLRECAESGKTLAMKWS
jgi:hypothetical protein